MPIEAPVITAKGRVSFAIYKAPTKNSYLTICALQFQSRFEINCHNTKFLVMPRCTGMSGRLRGALATGVSCPIDPSLSIRVIFDYFLLAAGLCLGGVRCNSLTGIVGRSGRE